MSFLKVGEMTPLHEGFASSVGRTVTICQHLEDCAHHVMVVYAVTDRKKEGMHDSGALREVPLSLRKVSLGGSVHRLCSSSDFESYEAALEAGTVARNWLVHEARSVVHIASSPSRVLERLRDFNLEMRALCKADWVLATASYEICEREPALVERQEYIAALCLWALEPVVDAIGGLADGRHNQGDSDYVC